MFLCARRLMPWSQTLTCRRNARAADQEKEPLLEDQDGVHQLQHSAAPSTQHGSIFEYTATKPAPAYVADGRL